MNTTELYRALRTVHGQLLEAHERLVRNRRLYSSREDPDAVKLGRDLDECQRRLEQSQVDLKDESLRIAFVGSMKSGKSTLVNELLQLSGADRLPAQAKRTTANVTVLRHASDPRARERAFVEYLSRDEYVRCLQDLIAGLGVSLPSANFVLSDDASYESVRKTLNDHPNRRDKERKDDFDYVIDFLQAGQQEHRNVALWGSTEHTSRAEGERLLVDEGEDRPSLRRRLVKSVTLSLSGSLIPEGVEIVDLPGAGAIQVRDTVIAKNYLRKIHGVVVLTQATAIGQGTDFSYARTMYGSRERLDDKLFLCITKCDNMNPSEIEGFVTSYEEVVRQSKTFLGIEKPRVYLLAAYDAREREKGKPAPETFQKLREWSATAPEGVRAAIEQMIERHGLLHFADAFFQFAKEEGQRAKLREVLATLRATLDSLLSQIRRSEADTSEESVIEQMILQRQQALNNRIDKIHQAVFDLELEWTGEPGMPVATTDAAREEFKREVEAIDLYTATRAPEIAKALLRQGFAANGDDVRRKVQAEFDASVAARLGTLVGERLGGAQGWDRIWQHAEIGGFLQPVIDSTAKVHGATSQRLRSLADRYRDLFVQVSRIRAVAEEWRGGTPPATSGKPPGKVSTSAAAYAGLAAELVGTPQRLAVQAFNKLRVVLGGYFRTLARDFRDELLALLSEREHASRIAACGALERAGDSRLDDLLARKQLSDDLKRLLGSVSADLDRLAQTLSS